MKTLLIFDIHQNLPWAEAILTKEDGNFDRLILGGDYFDTFDRNLPNVQQTAAWLRDIPQRFGDRVTMLMGNHDIPYAEVFRANGIPEKVQYPCSGFSIDRAQSAYKLLEPDWFHQHCCMYTWAGDYLVSHAGLSMYWTILGGVQGMLEEADRGFRDMGNRYCPMLDAGPCRGGLRHVGGITWLDWIDEFTDHEDLPPQIVGHTGRAGPAQKGRSWCLDGNQTCYGLLDENELQVRFTEASIPKSPAERHRKHAESLYDLIRNISDQKKEPKDSGAETGQ